MYIKLNKIGQEVKVYPCAYEPNLKGNRWDGIDIKQRIEYTDEFDPIERYWEDANGVS